jgi:pimeloyl-ACP methyl ester carboxylesterase
MSNRSPPTLHAHRGIAVWSGGLPSADLDIWLLHAFADSHLCFREAFAQPIAARARLLLFDLPGHGASPAREAGLTVDEAAELCCELIGHFSPARRVVLVGHSMAGIVATRAARMLDAAPRLVVSVEGNLTLADAYFTGQAAAFDDPEAFFAAFQSRILEMAERDEVMRRFSCSVQCADPRTLWTLGRSVLGCSQPGKEFAALACPAVYYCDPASVSAETGAFLAEHRVRQREFRGLGHWPMLASPTRFYAALEQDAL